MLDKSEANSIKNDYLETLQTIINRIIQKKEQPEKGAINNNISIVVGQKTVFEGENVQKPKINDLKSGDVKKIETALNNPESFKGSITIKVDDKEVFNIDKGKLVKDELGLSNAPVTKPAVKERTYTVKELQKQVEVLKNKLSEQEKTIAKLNSEPQSKETLEKLTQEMEKMAESLNKQQKLIEETQKSLNQMSLAKPQNSRLQNWIGSIENKVKEVSNSFLDSAKNQLKQVGERINNSLNGAKNKMIEVSVITVLNKLGNRQPDGSLSFTSNKYQFHQEGDKITLRTKEGEKLMENGKIAPSVTPAQEMEVKQLPEKVFKLIDEMEKEEKEKLMTDISKALTR